LSNFNACAGTFGTAIEAARAFDQGVLTYNLPTSRLNFPLEEQSAKKKKEGFISDLNDANQKKDDFTTDRNVTLRMVVAKDNETVMEIAECYGLAVEDVLECNTSIHGLHAHANLYEGTQVYLPSSDSNVIDNNNNTNVQHSSQHRNNNKKGVNSFTKGTRLSSSSSSLSASESSSSVSGRTPVMSIQQFNEHWYATNRNVQSLMAECVEIESLMRQLKQRLKKKRSTLRALEANQKALIGMKPYS
jgi:hypothetical protein